MCGGGAGGEKLSSKVRWIKLVRVPHFDLLKKIIRKFTAKKGSQKLGIKSWLSQCQDSDKSPRLRHTQYVKRNRLKGIII